MATNFFFNNFGSSQEQSLVENLIIESIKIYGIDTYYIPRTVKNRDAIFREAEYSSFDSAILVEMYIKNTDAFEGDGEFLSKFGIQVRDQITFTIAQRVFAEEVGDNIGKSRPQEGDLIYFPLTNTVYQIKLVDVKAVFYQFGALQTYDITCELYESNSDVFNTGIPQIDLKYNALTLVSDGYDLLTETGYMLITESGEILLLETYRVENIDAQAQNEEFEREAQDIIDFTERDPFSEGVRS